MTESATDINKGKPSAKDIENAAQVEPHLLLPISLAQNLAQFLAQLDLKMDMGNARSNFVMALDKLDPYVPEKPEE